ncbi:MAG: glycoside hydrolase family 3 protein, partial [Bacteroidota bacterium]
EMAAVGVNVNYAPCVDVNVNPHNPVVGIRSFGEHPDMVARLGAAMIEGIQSQGVAATAKHFPGHGDTATDSHLGLPILPHSLERLRGLEFVPFRASVEAGVKLIMAAHIGLPAVDGQNAPPASLSPGILQNLLRREVGYKGVIITDALDMHAIPQGEALGGQAIKAAVAGADLLLVTSSPDDQHRIYAALLDAARRGVLSEENLLESARRVTALRAWLAESGGIPELDVIASAAHMQVAEEIAQHSITLVRDHGRLLPLRLDGQKRIAGIVPRPLDLTPADTSSYITPKLAEALRQYHPRVDELVIPYAPDDSDIAGLLQRIPDYDLMVIGTLNAFDQEAQARLVRELLKTGVPAVVVALRLPYDLAAFPEASCYVCTYSLLEPSMRALAAFLFGRMESTGRLPVSIPGLYTTGHSFHR